MFDDAETAEFAALPRILLGFGSRFTSFALEDGSPACQVAGKKRLPARILVRLVEVLGALKLPDRPSEMVFFLAPERVVRSSVEDVSAG